MSKVYFNLASGTFQQDWTNTGLITGDDDWSGVPGIEGFEGQGLTASPGENAGAVLGDSAVAGDLHAIANQLTPTSVFTGGVAEFQLGDPTTALQGSGTADAPHIVLYLNSSGRQNIVLSFVARDIDISIDDAIQQIAVQYRVGETGAWINL